MNGVLIYEGDIIREKPEWNDDEDWFLYQVQWAEAYSGLQWCAVDANTRQYNYYGGLPFLEHTAVVGNIHENPELMENNT
jgi:hypothetical protein